MRDQIKDKLYFLNQISVFRNSISEIEDMILTGKTANDRINFMKRAAVGDSFNIINSLYSGDQSISEIKNQMTKCIKLIYESWDGFWKLNYKGKILNQYVLSAYDQMLWMLSLGYLLDISEEEFKKLVDVIDRDGVKDYLFEFIIRAKLGDRQQIETESYEFGWILFGKLRQAILETDKTKAEKLVKEFITKDWYKEHKNSGWYNSHKSPNKIYCGYWSFETAAIVKIMGLDDSTFLDCPHYPKDLVNPVNKFS